MDANTKACQEILSCQLFTTSDAYNVVRALELRLAATPLTQPQRHTLGKILMTAKMQLHSLLAEVNL